MMFNPSISKKRELLFYKRVRKTRGCWTWVGTKNKLGYGLLMVNRKVIRAHRLSMFLSVGSFDNKLNVCHHCDNPSCVKPEHLFLGTQKDNMQDCANKGRTTLKDRAICGHRYDKVWGKNKVCSSCENKKKKERRKKSESYKLWCAEYREKNRIRIRENNRRYEERVRSGQVTKI